MKKLKLSPVDLYKLRLSQRLAAEVVTVVKQNKLDGQALADMKTLEDVVSNLEVITLALGH